MNEAEKELIEGCSVVHPGPKEIVYRVIYEAASGEIVGASVDEVELRPGLKCLVVDKETYETPGLIPKYEVRGGKITAIDFDRNSQTRLEKKEDGEHTTTKDNILFVDKFGDKYGNRTS